PISLSSAAHFPSLHPFPTRRSSDLAGLRPLYQAIRQNFEHLDGHLKLFTPLQRRLYRNAQEISGTSVRNYVKDLFSNRLERHDVDRKSTRLNSSHLGISYAVFCLKK